MPASPIVLLRAGETVGDAAFDRIYPDWARRPSRIHWTPVAVAQRAAELLAGRGRARVLDVGSGVGKLCIIGALTTMGSFVGVEQRRPFVELARDIVRRFHVKRCEFIHDDVIAVDWQTFDAFYLFNPFAEYLPWSPPIDEMVERTPLHFVRCVRFAEARLRDARRGTRVVTYHGFGGTMPAGWREVVREVQGSGPLALWIKE